LSIEPIIPPVSADVLYERGQASELEGAAQDRAIRIDIPEEVIPALIGSLLHADRANFMSTIE
jgi:hypothetical protein